MEATSLLASFRIVTSYILKGVLSSNMKLFRRYQQEILQCRDQECVNDLWKNREERGEKEESREEERARYNSDVLPFAIMRMSHAFSVYSGIYDGVCPGSFNSFQRKVRGYIISGK